MIESKKTINVMSGSKRRSHVGVEVSKIYNPKLGCLVAVKPVMNANFILVCRDIFAVWKKL
jgi:hypothetical protein